VRYIMLDRIVDLHVARSATGVKCVTLSDDSMREHFGWAPIFPGALMIESMAQLAGALIEETAVAAGRVDEVAVFVGIDKARFRRGAHPGDQIVLEATFVANKEIAASLQVQATINSKLVASAELHFLVNRGAAAELVAERRKLRQMWRTSDGYPESVEDL
jgi:3-hydroxyacyl-[acyl-carrier-protein] dehydratase